MTYPAHWSSVRYCRISYTLGDVGVWSAGTPVSDTPTMPKPSDFEKPMVSDRKTFAQIQAERHRQAREDAEQWQRWSQEVTEQLYNERSKFADEFTEAEQRINDLIND